MTKTAPLALLPLLLAATSAASLLPAPAAAEQAIPRDLTVEQAAAARAGTAKPAGLEITVSSDHSDGTYAAGETARLFVKANEDAYVTVLNVGPSGQVTQLFPNAYQPDNRLAPGRPVEIAGGKSGAHLTIAGPVRRELIKVIASSKPLTVIGDAQLQGGGIFRGVQGGVPTLTRNLELTAKPADGKIAIENFSLTTVASRTAAEPVVLASAPAAPAPAPAAATPAVLAVAVPAAGAVPAAVPAAQGTGTLLPVVTPSAAPLLPPAVHAFPPLLAVDRPSYKVGEHVTLAVTSMQACHLTVLDVTPAGTVRVLFPNRVTPNDAVGAMQTVLVSGSPSPVTLTAAMPAGTETVMALCATDASPIVAAVAAQGAAQGADVFPLAGDRAEVARNLSLAGSRPDGTLSTASLSFAVAP